ncbi:FAD-dependent oxidoreductase [Cellvibrio sp. KY-YJ-3]|uniref:FAD-dependent oxidoreductase n=1 Tax=Cellvibrio sp. KY-YJ-3 TaxID=454662 RepID=UPI001245ABAC|nr:FAD-dependent oxidoreductase [Cellvibrio sp. KY-YJ-3]QEY12795.1 FAD-dependent oxidoreductase [Cellvibrio sp. KY-YJ-3]
MTKQSATNQSATKQSTTTKFASHTNVPQRIAIAGAGLLGRLLAWQLNKAGLDVTLFEAGSFTPTEAQSKRAAAFTAAGMVAPLSEAVVSDEGVYRMGQFALAHWPRWIKQLNDDLPSTGGELFFNNGSLVVAHPQDESELEQFARELKFVIPNCHSYQRVTQTQIQELEPDLNPHFQQGLFLAEEGHLHNRRFLRLLGEQIMRSKITLREHSMVEVSPGKVMVDGENEAFDLVIDCRGLGAKTQIPKLRGVRGETLHVQTTEIQLQRPVRLMHPRYQLYVVPKPDNYFVIGATQIESEDRSPVTLQSSLELSSALYTVSPAFAEARIIEMDTNLRPAFMDNLPKVDIQDGLISANGLFRHGYLLAPAVVENVLAHIFKKPEAIFSALLNHH